MPRAIEVVAGPAVEPVTLAELRAHCRVDDRSEDRLLLGYAEAARHHVERVTRRALVEQTIRATWDGWPAGDMLELPGGRVSAVSEVSYRDTDGVPQVLPAEAWRLVAESVPPIVLREPGTEWPDVGDGPASVRVTYVAGYGATPESVPRPLRQAILMLAAHSYENREASTVAAMAAVPMGVDALVWPFRLMGATV